MLNRFKVTGRRNGNNAIVYVDAPNADEARMMAARKGLIIRDVFPVEKKA